MQGPTPVTTRRAHRPTQLTAVKRLASACGHTPHRIHRRIHRANDTDLLMVVRVRPEVGSRGLPRAKFADGLLADAAPICQGKHRWEVRWSTLA